MVKSKSIYTVSKVNEYIKDMFANEYFLSMVFVSGEVSNCKYHSSGHIYFTLKDKMSQISCVMFAGQRGGLSFSMKDGNQVIVGGSVRVYERDGKYQLYARQIEAAGEGAL
ncbi:MAG: exodeoxyribonuclease VII large subunit, partial [Lachnoclostridium sp.]|nr:exodeoxyribonuclease VII large subunit [Lachnoclostridium sp.]